MSTDEAVMKFRRKGQMLGPKGKVISQCQVRQDFNISSLRKLKKGLQQITWCPIRKGLDEG